MNAHSKGHQILGFILSTILVCTRALYFQETYSSSCFPTIQAKEKETTKYEMKAAHNPISKLCRTKLNLLAPSHKKQNSFWQKVQ